MGRRESQMAPDTAEPVNRFTPKSPRILGFRAPRQGGRDCLLRKQWRRIGNPDPTFSEFGRFHCLPKARSKRSVRLPVGKAFYQNRLATIVILGSTQPLTW